MAAHLHLVFAKIHHISRNCGLQARNPLLSFFFFTRHKRYTDRRAYASAWPVRWNARDKGAAQDVLVRDRMLRGVTRHLGKTLDAVTA